VCQINVGGSKFDGIDPMLNVMQRVMCTSMYVFSHANEVQKQLLIRISTLAHKYTFAHLILNITLNIIYP